MKKSFRLLKFINIIVSVGCGLFILNGVLALVLTPFIPPLFEFHFNLKDTGLFNGTDGNTYPFTTIPMSGVAWFPKGFQPNYTQNIYIFLIYSTMVVFFFNFTKFINAATGKDTFELKNYSRLQYMRLSLLIMVVLEILHFFLFQRQLNELVQHESIELINTFSWRIHFNWYALLGGLIFLVLAEVFKEGFTLKQESELTI